MAEDQHSVPKRQGGPIDTTIFSRYLNTEPLGHRRRGTVACIFHDDHHPSLSIDLDRGLFHCFGCGAEGGLIRFAELVGERPPQPPRVGQVEDFREQARRQLRAQGWGREGTQPMYRVADAIRRCRCIADRRRCAAHGAGGTDTAWTDLTIAAHFDRIAECWDADPSSYWEAIPR